MAKLSSRLADHMLRYAHDAEQCTTLEALGALAAASVGQAGMTAIASGMLTGRRVLGGDPFHFNNWPDAWRAHYQARGFMERDPLPRWALVSGAPCRWTGILARLPASDPGHEIAAEALGFGFAEGVVTPVRTCSGHLGLVSVGGPGPEIGEEAFHYLQSVSTTTLHRAEAIEVSSEHPAVPHLSRREQECVTLLTQGMTEHEIAGRLGIREVTARFHLDNARRKTGARSRIHLAGIAGQWLGRSWPGRLQAAPKKH